MPNKKRIGFFATINLNSSGFALPSFYSGKTFRLEFTGKNILCLRFGEGIKKSLTENDLKRFAEIIGDDMAVIYFDEDSIYMSPYRYGEEYIRKNVNI